MSYVDSYLQRVYSNPQQKPLDIPVEVDVSTLPVEERLTLSENKQKKLEQQVEMLTRMIPAQGCEGR